MKRQGSMAEVALRAALDDVRARCDVAARRAADPVSFVHRYSSADDRELVALASACAAFGNVTTIRAKLQDLFDRVGPSPARAADDPAALRSRLRTWKHRVFRGDDMARLLAGARAVQRAHGSLGARFALDLEQARASGESEYVRAALGTWCEAIRRAGGLRRGGSRRGPAHLLPDARGSSANKRLLLFLRWMVRPDDGVDLGLWSQRSGMVPADLLVPVDVHIHKLSRNLGLTRRRTPSWQAAVDITQALARFDSSDPTKYDFSLCHLGMLKRCPSRRDAKRCDGCPVMPVCIHWQGA